MAVNQSRSMTMDLFEGISDGVVKKLTPDRGGLQDSRESAIVKGDLLEIYDAVYSQNNMLNAVGRLAYDRVAASPYMYPPGQDQRCNTCGNTGCAC